VVATDPALAIETFVARAERELAQQTEALAALRMKVPALSEQYARGRAAAGEEPGFEIIVPIEDIRRQLYLAAEAVRRDIRSVEHLPGTAGFEELRVAQYGLLARGVRDRLVIATDRLLDPEVFAHYERLEARGHCTRTLPDVGTRMLLYDKDLAVLPVDPTNLDLGAIFIRVRSVIDLLIFMYDHIWSIAKPVFSVQLDWQTPSGRPARVLELIAAGTKDETIARTLRVAVRTVRRDIAELKQALNVNTRAEVVAAAVRKGWL
jgi:DNA-binding CsgD family transcriptional regulator